VVLGFTHVKDGTRWAGMPAIHFAKSGEEFRTIDIFMLGDCAEERGQSADA
jgi:hypothetical protein